MLKKENDGKTTIKQAARGQNIANSREIQYRHTGDKWKKMERSKNNPTPLLIKKVSLMIHKSINWGIKIIMKI